jgi:hypothetical protein
MEMQRAYFKAAFIIKSEGKGSNGDGLGIINQKLRVRGKTRTQDKGRSGGFKVRTVLSDDSGVTLECEQGVPGSHVRRIVSSLISARARPNVVVVIASEGKKYGDVLKVSMRR